MNNGSSSGGYKERFLIWCSKFLMHFKCVYLMSDIVEGFMLITSLFHSMKEDMSSHWKNGSTFRLKWLDNAGKSGSRMADLGIRMAAIDHKRTGRQNDCQISCQCIRCPMCDCAQMSNMTLDGQLIGQNLHSHPLLYHLPLGPTTGVQSIRNCRYQVISPVSYCVSTTFMETSRAVWESMQAIMVRDAISFDNY